MPGSYNICRFSSQRCCFWRLSVLRHPISTQQKKQTFLSSRVCRAGLHTADTPDPAANVEVDRRMACRADCAGHHLCDRMGRQAACRREHLERHYGQGRKAALTKLILTLPTTPGKANLTEFCKRKTLQSTKITTLPKAYCIVLISF